MELSSFPQYMFTRSRKNFYDRFAYMCHQPRFRDKAAMFIVTTELTGGKETLAYMRFPAFAWGFKLCIDVEVVYRGFKNGGKYREKALNQISQAAKTFHSALTSDGRKILFRELMFFNLMKAKVTLHKDFLPEDYHYWQRQGWLDQDFYSEKGIPKLKSAMAKTLVRKKVKKILKSCGLEAKPLTTVGHEARTITIGQ